MLSQACEEAEDEDDGGMKTTTTDSTAAEDGDNSSSGSDVGDDEANVIKSCPTSPAREGFNWSLLVCYVVITTHTLLFYNIITY